ncbi:hypothetical protein BS627_04755 [Agrobacterium salinitolerans]|uniref:hypothetical protein n=1 Tax=Agrobacterium salinitolerans TaxID=1183413 RepID=UPI00098EEA3D|nr:hypothetical protein [Agrobacterium salinitolerans]OOO26363.1 hypothetical protein BS627_04755 [Agrobacterium salinitolerans]PNQ24546.1 hypothetical protein C2E26_04840 [Rhizobium sp. YIC5082]
MKTFTFDTNCLIALSDETRSEHGDVLKLVEASKKGLISVAMVASSAAERQLSGEYLGNIAGFKQRMADLNLDHVELLRPIGTYGMTFHDHAIYPDDAQMALQTQIFETLFPTTPASWPDHAADLGQSTEDTETPAGVKWRNKFLDAQGMWGHINYGRDVFVTSDANFARRFKAREEFKRVVIATPSEAVEMLTTA